MRKKREVVILASASPRRREILRRAGIAFRARPAQVDERRKRGEQPADYAVRIARAKAAAAARPGEMVLGADTIVVVGGRILGKPRDKREAARMLRLLSGRAHRVLTGICLLRDGRVRAEVVSTRVWFRRLSDAEIAAYVATGEPLDKAGAYAIQGRASKFVERIEGCYFNVMGLPVARVWRLLQGASPGTYLLSCEKA
jgi:septum formation protein